MKNRLAEISINYKSNSKVSSRIKISSPDEALEQFRLIWNEKIEYQESFYLLLLNKANHVLGFTVLSSGSTNGVLVDIKMILQTALKSNAHAIIVAHNHPSGNINPSSIDNELTRKLKRACETIDLNLLDHLIISREEFYSYQLENNPAL